MVEDATFIGFGEAGQAFAEGIAGAHRLRAFDIKTLDPATSNAKLADYRRYKIVGTASLGDALADAEVVISVVTADQALGAARQAAEVIASGALFFDFNSVAPDTKRAAAAAIEAAGGRYVDVAVMAPVQPARLKVPLLVSGAAVEEACAMLSALGFHPKPMGQEVGRASAIKMLRSVMVKGIEALTAQCFLAAHKAGVVEEVRASLNASWPGVDWADKADYNLDRMLVHGLRRAAEMDEVAKTLDGLGTGSEMARATSVVQGRIGSLGLPSAEGLAAKTESILKRPSEAA